MTKTKYFTVSLIILMLILSFVTNVQAQPPIPSSFYGEIHILDDPPSVGTMVDAYVPGVGTPVTSAAIKQENINEVPTLVYNINVPGDLPETTLIKESGVEGEVVTFKIGDRIIGKGVWHSGTNINLNFHPPQAIPGGPYEGTINSPIAFSGSAEDTGNDVESYAWDFDNDGIYETEGQTASHTWATNGTFPIGFKVVDAQGGEGIATLEVTVSAINVTVTLAGLDHVYNGSPKSVIVTTNPSDLEVSVTYDGSTDPPTNAGVYVVVATVTTPGYQGSATENFTIAKATATITVTDQYQVYDGGPKEITVTTNPPDVNVTVTYTGNASPPSLPGDYAFIVEVTDSNYTGNPITGNMLIRAKQSITLVDGWNLVSFNLLPYPSSEPVDVLESIVGSYDLVYAWDASVSSNNWLKHDNIPDSTDTLTYLSAQMGFWIHMTAGATLDVYGFFPSTSNIPLSTTAGGWNLVGYPSSGNLDMPGALTEHGVSNFISVYAYQANDLVDPWKLYDPALANSAPYANDLSALAPGWGYWIQVGTAATWTVVY